MTKISPFAGKLPAPPDLVDLSKLLADYESKQPDPSQISQQVSFGTSGHRGSSLNASFNRDHILAITQSVCLYRKKKNITGPLFLGFDTHALSLPAFQSALEVLAANEVITLIAPNQEFTPTPVISHAILNYNQGRTDGLADGIILTPSHNPPTEGGIKYNPEHGGPASTEITNWIQNQANEILKYKLKDVLKIPFERAIKAPTTRMHDYLHPYVKDLAHIVDLPLIRDSKIKLAVDPLGGAGVHYWQVIADFYKIDLTVLNTKVDPQFAFMTRDWDGQIRMDPSSPYAMQSVLEKSKNYALTFACDTDHDRHGIVTKNAGLMPANHYLATCIDYLFKNRTEWDAKVKIGKTIVSSSMIDRVARSLNRSVYEVPVGFKWFVDGLLDGSLGFVGEESAGAAFLRMNGKVWTTEKDALIPCLLAAEMTAKTGKNPSALYHDLEVNFGTSHYARIEAPADREKRDRFKKLTPEQITSKDLASEKIENVLTKAPGNQASIGGIKVETKNGWFAARPSGTEDIYKIYAESFVSQSHLKTLLTEAQQIVDASLK